MATATSWNLHAGERAHRGFPRFRFIPTPARSPDCLRSNRASSMGGRGGRGR